MLSTINRPDVYIPLEDSLEDPPAVCSLDVSHITGYSLRLQGVSLSPASLSWAPVGQSSLPARERESKSKCTLPVLPYSELLIQQSFVYGCNTKKDIGNIASNEALMLKIKVFMLWPIFTLFALCVLLEGY